MYLLPAHCSLLKFHNSLFNVLWYFRCPAITLVVLRSFAERSDAAPLYPRCSLGLLHGCLLWVFLHDFPGVLFHLLLGLDPLISVFLKNNFMYLLFGSAGSSFLCGLFSSYGTQGDAL